MGTIFVMAKTGIGVRPENRCTARVKATGKRCPAAKVTLKTVDGESIRYRVCLGHLSALAPREKIAERHGWDPKNNKGGRPPKPTVTEVLRQMVEEDIETWLAPLQEGIIADRGVVVGNGPYAEIEFVPDHDVRLKAHAMALDRVYGKPKQTTELSGPDGGPIAMEVPTGEERQRQVAALLGTALGHTAASSTNGHNGGNGHVD